MHPGVVRPVADAPNDLWTADFKGQFRTGDGLYCFPLTIADLPAPGTKRWVIRRKAEVVAAVRGGLLSLEEACSRYTLTVEEFLSWQYSIDQHGLAGLRTTRIQQYRQ